MDLELLVVLEGGRPIRAPLGLAHAGRLSPARGGVRFVELRGDERTSWVRGRAAYYRPSPAQLDHIRALQRAKVRTGCRTWIDIIPLIPGRFERAPLPPGAEPIEGDVAFVLLSPDRQRVAVGYRFERGARALTAIYGVTCAHGVGDSCGRSEDAAPFAEGPDTLPPDLTPDVLAPPPVERGCDVAGGASRRLGAALSLLVLVALSRRRRRAASRAARPAQLADGT